MNQRLKRKGLIGFTALAALIFTLPAHAQDDDEIKKNNAKGDTLTFNVSDFVLPEGANLDRLLRKLAPAWSRNGMDTCRSCEKPAYHAGRRLRLP